MYRSQKKGFSVCLLCAVVFLSCGAGTDFLWVDYDSFPEPEKSFLASVLTAKELAKLGLVSRHGSGPGVLAVRYRASWVTWAESDRYSPGSYTAGDSSFLPLSRTCMVPRAEPWEGKTGIRADEARRAFSPAMDTDKTVVPLKDLGPPYICRKVDGLDVTEPAYPLVLLGGVEFDYTADADTLTGKGRRVQKKLDGIADCIGAALRKGAVSTGSFPRYEERPRLYRIAAGGDAMLARGVQEILFEEGPSAVMDDTAALVKGADLSLVNLEGVVTDRGTPAEKAYAFRFDPAVARALKEAGFDAALTANNHAFDYGRTGFLDTLSHLEKAGLYALGAGRSINAAASPFVTGPEQFPVRVFGIASFGRERSGWDGLDYAADENTPGMLHGGKRGADFIKAQLGVPHNTNTGLEIVFFHGGIEYADYPDEATRTLYTELVEAGADLVIGTHPHVEQGFEWVAGKPVFWSLGDYIFNEMDDTPGGDKGIFIVVSFLGTTLVYMEVYPVFMNGPRTVIAADVQLERFYRLTRELAHN